MGLIEPGHLVIILIIVLIIFGPGKLTNVFGELGRGVKEFREATETKPGTPPQVTPGAPATAAPAASSQQAAAAAGHCTSCGAALSAGALFCAKCGTKVA